MTAELAIRFLLGRYHATPWGENANEGGVEWPPSPWRLLRALYATWRNRVPSLDDEVVLGLLDKLASTPEYYLPRFATSHTRHYLPGPSHKEVVAGDISKVLDAFVSVAPGDELVVRWDVDLSTREREALATLAENLTYLGRAEAVCEVTARFSADPPAGERCAPCDDSASVTAVSLLVPDRPLSEADLTVTTTRLRTKLKHREPPGTSRVRYPRLQPGPDVSARRAQPRPALVTAVRWSLATSARPSRYATVAWADTLRRAAQCKYGHAHNGASSPVFSGKSADGTPSDGQHGHAHWLAFAQPGDPLLSTLVAWAPRGFDADELDALCRVTRLVRRGISDVHTSALGLEGWGDVANIAPEIARPSHVWASYTPFAPTRHHRRDPRTFAEFAADNARRELELRGFPSAAIVVDEPSTSDWHHFRRYRPDKDERSSARRAVGMRLTFDEAVSGPIAIGALSHFGLGLFTPVDPD